MIAKSLVDGNPDHQDAMTITGRRLLKKRRVLRKLPGQQVIRL
ncbi:MAG: hypothetical protein QM757_43805 [Paludibaculum sp.]